MREQPYDHTADLWSLGCILYEIAVGKPPFYTNNIFQLVNQIVQDPVKWPLDTDRHFQNFIQGLLTKDPRRRLAWPEASEHPFLLDADSVETHSKHDHAASPIHNEAKAVPTRTSLVQSDTIQTQAGTAAIPGEVNAGVGATQWPGVQRVAYPPPTTMPALDQRNVGAANMVETLSSVVAMTGAQQPQRRATVVLEDIAYVVWCFLFRPTG